MTYNFTGNSSAFPWFETQRGGLSNGCALRLDATKAVVLQVRMKFNNIQTAGTVNLKPLFGSGTNDEADQYYDHVLEIPASEISTNNKWFTYTIPLGDKLKSLLLDSKVTIRYILDLTGFTGEVSELFMILTYEDLNGEEKTVTLENPVLYNEKLGYYSLDFDGLLAAELRQPVRATAYCGEKAVTGTLEYSASTYGKGKTGELGDLCMCLMSYSDSAKTYFAQ